MNIYFEQNNKLTALQQEHYDVNFIRVEQSGLWCTCCKQPVCLTDNGVKLVVKYYLKG